MSHAKKNLLAGFADYGGEEPTFVVDCPRLTPEERPPPVTHASWQRPRHDGDRERRVIGYARVKTAMTFHRGGGRFEDLEVGTVIELLDPTDYEASELQHWESKNQQHVVVRWVHGSCLVLGRDIERVHADAWRKQVS